MATPAEHQTSAEAILERLARGGVRSPGHVAELHAHAALAQTLGTGDHYDAADALLAKLKPDMLSTTRSLIGEEALGHALLADR